MAVSIVPLARNLGIGAARHMRISQVTVPGYESFTGNNQGLHNIEWRIQVGRRLKIKDHWLHTLRACNSTAWQNLGFWEVSRLRRKA